MSMPKPYEVLKELREFLADETKKGDDRRFGVVDLCAKAMDALDEYVAEGHGDANIIRSVVHGHVGKAQEAVGLQ